MLCNTISAIVGPVLPGQSLWCINKRIASEVDNIESKLDNLCHATMITGPGTITEEGSYCLGNEIVGTLTIAASNVHLDLSHRRITDGLIINSGLTGVTVENGVVEGGSDAISVNGASDIIIHDVTVKNGTRGINFVGVSDSLITNCDMILNTTGLELNGCQKITVKDCVAGDNVFAGYSLISSSTNTFENCKALSTGVGNTNITNTTIFGFVSNNGFGNIFERCIANATQALSTTDANSLVAGFAFRGSEGCSKIINSEAANSVTSSSGFTIPYGILLESRLDSVNTVTAITLDLANDLFVLGVSWSPDGQYLAVGGPFNQGTAKGIRVYKFDRAKQLLILMDAIISTGEGDNTAVQWSPSGAFIAATGTFNGTNSLFIFRFDVESEKLVQLTAAGPADADAIPLAWSPDEKYIVTGEANNNISIRLFRFDSVAESLTQVFTVQVGGEVNSYSWSPDGNYIAVGAATTTNDLFVYRFNRSAQTLTQVDSVNPDGGSAGDIVRAVAWSPNGQYLAAGGLINGTTNNDLFLYRFSRTTETLTQVDSVNPDGGGVADQVFALNWSPDSNYLIVGGIISGTTNNDFFVYQFNRATEKLIQFAAINPDGGSTGDVVTGLNWSPDGGYIAVMSQTADNTSVNNLFIFSAFQFPFKNVIKGNTVYCNSGGTIPGGIGISGSSICNYIVGNTAYSNPINAPIIGSNYQFVTNIFNQPGSAPSHLQNISLATCEPILTPDNVGLLVKQTLSKTTDIQSKVDILVACAPIPLTAEDIVAGVITLNTPGCYCLSTDLTTDIVITASCVCLDLMERCLTGVISLSDADNIVVNNGFVNPPAPIAEPNDAAITIAATVNSATIDKVMIDCADTLVADVSGRIGILTSGNDVQILNCTVKSGSATPILSGGIFTGGHGIAVADDANRTLIKNCVILATGNGSSGTTGVNGGSGGHGFAITASPAFTEIIECIVFSTGNGGNAGDGATTGGDGGSAVFILSGIDTSVRNCTMRNTGVGGTGGAANGADGRAVEDLQTVTANFSMIFSNFAHNIANAVKYNIQNTGVESGVLTPNPPTSTVINPLANVYAS